MAAEVLGLWEVTAPAKATTACDHCKHKIGANELLFTWCPFAATTSDRTPARFHAACAVRAGTLGPQARVRHATVRKALGLTKRLREELDAICDALEPPELAVVPATAGVARRPATGAASRARASAAKPALARASRRAVQTCHQQKRITSKADGSVEKACSRVQRRQIFRPGTRTLLESRTESRNKRVKTTKNGRTIVTETLTIRRVRSR
eukprot:TRINITY_DN23544_c0_g2_i2.p1 TRINITY_DN23544_c0_g2~~TRINITY_DN23544_c0_g2_i2.p1  ORF type:complete len:210 (+),score=26.72 TRINITY_DN23544_c0_g2_i2:118-747(+)